MPVSCCFPPFSTDTGQIHLDLLSIASGHTLSVLPRGVKRAVSLKLKRLQNQTVLSVSTMRSQVERACILNPMSASILAKPSCKYCRHMTLFWIARKRARHRETEAKLEFRHACLPCGGPVSRFRRREDAVHHDGNHGSEGSPVTWEGKPDGWMECKKAALSSTGSVSSTAVANAQCF